MSNRYKQSTILGIKANATRVLELIDAIDFNNDVRFNYYKEVAELKGKMKELRRDTIKLEKEMKGY